MAYERWYPNSTILPDGRVLAITGSSVTDRDFILIPEIYDPATNVWTRLTGASKSIPTYGHFFVLPNGKVVYSGNWEGASDIEVLDVTTQTWSVVDSTLTDGYSVMYEPGKIMKAGSSADSGSAGASGKLTNWIDFTEASPAWHSSSPMANARTHHNLTILPDGNVLVTGGSTQKEGYIVGNAVYPAEMWSPVSKTWTTMASAATPRLYHSEALLLPDARVLVSGGGRDGPGVDQFNAEIYSPPYLFKGARPSISSVPDTVSYGSSFSVISPEISSIASIALMHWVR